MYMYIPLAWAAIAGGTITLVGSTPQLVAQGIMVKSGVAGFQMFALAWIGLPVGIVTIIYTVTIGYSISKRIYAGDIEACIAKEQAAATSEKKARRIAAQAG